MSIPPIDAPEPAPSDDPNDCVACDWCWTHFGEQGCAAHGALD